MSAPSFKFDPVTGLGDMGMTIPPDTQTTLTNYLLHGFPPGGFVTSMLTGDLYRALQTADIANRQSMWVVGMWIIRNAPRQSWGSPEAMQHWIEDIDGARSRYREEVEKQRMWDILGNQNESTELF